MAHHGEFIQFRIDVLSLFKLLPGLKDESDQWVVVRSHVLKALNRICGFHVDRSVIFLDEGARTVVADASQEWYQDLAGQLKSE